MGVRIAWSLLEHPHTFPSEKMAHSSDKLFLFLWIVIRICQHLVELGGLLWDLPVIGHQQLLTVYGLLSISDDLGRHLNVFTPRMLPLSPAALSISCKDPSPSLCLVCTSLKPESYLAWSLPAMTFLPELILWPMHPNPLLQSPVL